MQIKKPDPISLNRLLVIANPGVSQGALFDRASAMAEASKCKVEIVGFHTKLPDASIDDESLAQQLDLDASGNFV